jgi:hypothetical protein
MKSRIRASWGASEKGLDATPVVHGGVEPVVGAERVVVIDTVKLSADGNPLGSAVAIRRELYSIALAVAALSGGCGKRSEPARQVPNHAPRAHDEASHDENHYFVVVHDDRLDPAELEVPTDVDLIVLFDFAADASCAEIEIEMTDKTIEKLVGHERPSGRDLELEVHAKFARGSHAVRCDHGPPRGMIKAR